MIDTSKWIEFNCKDLFECKNTGNILARDVVDGSGDTPFVTSSAFNNGVVAYIDASKYEIIKGHCILVGGKTFTISYQKEDFVSNDSHNFVIRVKDEISEASYLYLATMIRTYFGQKYKWNDAVTSDKLLKETIPLPATPDKHPDWIFMEAYMKQVMADTEKELENLQKIDNTKHPVGISKWKKFRVGDLFDIHPTKAYKLTNNKLMHEDGTNPIVVNSGFNNGIGGFTNYECTEKAGIITFTDTAAKSSESFFYQDEDFVGYPHVQGMYIREHVLTKNEGEFITTVLRATVGNFDFIIKMNRENIINMDICLPAKSTDEPDWQYMEDYMALVTDNANKTMDCLEMVVQ